MPQISTITVVGDGAVSYAFVPVGIAGPLATFQERVTSGSGLAASFPQLTASLNRPSKTSRNTKVRLKLVLPVMDTVDVTKVNHSNSADISFLLPDTSTSAERSNLLTLMSAALADAAVVAMVQDQDSLY